MCRIIVLSCCPVRITPAACGWTLITVECPLQVYSLAYLLMGAELSSHSWTTPPLHPRTRARMRSFESVLWTLVLRHGLLLSPKFTGLVKLGGSELEKSSCVCSSPLVIGFQMYPVGPSFNMGTPVVMPGLASTLCIEPSPHT